MKKITLEEAFAEQLEHLKTIPGLTQEDLDISFDDWKNKLGKNTFSEEKLKELYSNRNFYEKGKEKKVGDKLVFYLTAKTDENDNTIDLTLRSKLETEMHEFENKYDAFENIMTGKRSSLPCLAEKDSKESKLFSETETLFGVKDEK